MLYRVTHRTTYLYTQPVSIAHHALRLQPRDRPHQLVHDFALEIDPGQHSAADWVDYFGNPVCFLALDQSHEQLMVESRSLVEMLDQPPPNPQAGPAWDDLPGMLEHDLSDAALDARQFLYASPMAPTLDAAADYARPSFPSGGSAVAAALDLTSRIHRDFKFDPTATTVATPLRDVFAIRRGVCQDFAHLQIACLRAMGMPARYVSGYLLTHPPEGKERLVGVDASHAWASTWIPGLGWLDLDPTNDLSPNLEHVTVAWGRDYGDISPVRGVIVGGGEHTLDVAVDMTPLSPEPARPRAA